MDKLLGVIFPLIEKFIPNKNEQLEFQLELMKLDLEEFKEKKGIITRAFHLIFPFVVLVWLVLLIAQFYLKVSYFIEKDVWLMQDFVPKELHLVVLWFLCLLMPKKIMEVIADLIVRYVQNKFKK